MAAAMLMDLGSINMLSTYHIAGLAIELKLFGTCLLGPFAICFQSPSAFPRPPFRRRHVFY